MTQSASDPVLDVQDLHVNYEGILALQGIDFSVHPGELVALLGANGAGKTTTLKSIVGLVHPQRGRILYQGEPTEHLPPHKLIRKGIAMVPEGRRVFAESSLLENLEIGGYTHSSPAEFKQTLEEVFSLFPVLRERKQQLAGSLSGGEQQMLAMGRALMARPSLLLLDEPSMGLAPRLVETIFELVHRLHQRGITILLVEQNAHLSFEISDRVYILEGGRIVLSGTSAELRENRQVAEAYLGGGAT